MTVADFTTIINQLLPEPHAGLLAGILFGAKATIPKDFMDALIATGTLHIVALSGMNITILESLIGATLLPIIGRRWASAFTIALIIGFILFVGPSPSVIRAGIMGSLALLSTIFGKQKWGLFTFIITAAIMLIIHPAWIADVSFQLSALATLGLVLFGEKHDLVALPNSQAIRFSLREAPSANISNLPKLPAWQPIVNFVVDDLRITLAAQTFTIPLIFFTFRRISLVSPLTNILIGWVIQPLTVVGFLVSFFGWVWLPLGQVVSWVAYAFLQYIILAITLTAKLPFSSLSW